MRSIANFLRSIFIGPGQKDLLVERQGWSVAKRLLLDEWNSSSFGIMRITRLALTLANFVFNPTILIDELHRSNKAWVVGFCREVFFLVRLVFFVLVLFTDLYTSSWVLGVVMYFTLDILHKLSGQSLVWGKYSIDPKRSVLLSLINYGELTIAFAILYLHCDCLTWKPLVATQALYFSLVTATTLGYGDPLPSDVTGQRIVIAQLAVFVIYVLLFVNILLSRVPEEKRSSQPSNLK